jgi:hypothetical protein
MTWSPLVDLCNSLETTVHGGTDGHGDIDTQCTSIQEVMSTQLS